MMAGWTIVLDIGKTLSKASLWDESGVCVRQRSRPNQTLTVGAYRALDAAAIEVWLKAVLAQYATLGPIEAIIPVAHGAGAALIRDGRLQAAPLDYEWAGVAEQRAIYQHECDPFVFTGSPSLPAGLNLGLQLHWLDSLHSSSLSSAQILPWAQYWAWLLCGVAASEVTSLGCHTDLWRPFDRAPSELAVRRGWAERLAPPKPANTILGTLCWDLALHTGLSPAVKIYCGLHDSNAALLAARSHREIESHDATVLTTGTWFTAMRSPLQTDAARFTSLAERRDCLVNVDVSGAPVPSSRFMGGREIETLIGASARQSDAPPAPEQIKHAVRVVQSGAMILPSVVPGVGPFPNATLRWVGAPQDAGDAVVRAHLYAALMADASLDLIGSSDTLVIDGRFSSAPVFVQALARLRTATRVFVSHDENGVARGALRLVKGAESETTALERVPPLPIDLAYYRHRWRESAEASNQVI
ncbi:MAG: carbohydrate kinase [Pseudomonadota bacterium]|nr:carbohydrate kinase [Pseudomonadota bacterium]